MKHPIQITVNNELHDLFIAPNRTLLDILREDLGLTGAKIETVEGLADQTPDATALHPLQANFLTHGASQCGFCTPGMLMAGKALLDANSRPSESEVKYAIAGNLCRCTGYKKIVEAIYASGEGENE